MQLFSSATFTHCGHQVNAVVAIPCSIVDNTEKNICILVEYFFILYFYRVTKQCLNYESTLVFLEYSIKE